MRENLIDIASEHALCSICGNFLAEKGFVTRTGKIACHKSECTARLEVPLAPIYRTAETECTWGGCRRKLHVGYHIIRRNTVFCSVVCYERSNKKAPELVTCEWCGTTFFASKQAKVLGCSPSHRNLILSRAESVQRCGALLQPIDEFMRYAKARYEESSLRSVRGTLEYFAEFLIAKFIQSFEDATPRTISDFIAWCSTHGYGYKICYLNHLFQWQIATETRRSPNPVLPRFHRDKHSKSKPRPFTAEERAQAWDVLKEHGTELLRAFCALGDDCGPRYSEVHKILLGDLDMDSQQIYIALPVKNKEEGWVPFGELSARYLKEYLAVRPQSNSLRLFLREDGEPIGNGYVYRRLRELFRKVLGNPREKTWWSPFSFHRFRHSVASRLVRGGADLSTVMAVGRWKSVSGVEHYVELRPEDLIRSYTTALDKDTKGQVKQTSSLSPAEYIATKRKQQNLR